MSEINQSNFDPSVNAPFAIGGVGLFILKGDLVLLGERQGSHGEGEFGGPGGKIDHGMTIFETAYSELEEEVGADLKIKNLGFLCLSDLLDYIDDGKHFVDIGLIAEYESGEPVVMEPDKAKSWGWYSLDDLPGRLFGCFENYLEAYRTGKTFFPKEERL